MFLCRVGQLLAKEMSKSGAGATIAMQEVFDGMGNMDAKQAQEIRDVTVCTSFRSNVDVDSTRLHCVRAIHQQLEVPRLALDGFQGQAPCNQIMDRDSIAK